MGLENFPPYIYRQQMQTWQEQSGKTNLELAEMTAHFDFGKGDWDTMPDYTVSRTMKKIPNRTKGLLNMYLLLGVLYLLDVTDRTKVEDFLEKLQLPNAHSEMWPIIWQSIEATAEEYHQQSKIRSSAADTTPAIVSASSSKNNQKSFFSNFANSLTLCGVISAVFIVTIFVLIFDVYGLAASNGDVTTITKNATVNVHEQPDRFSSDITRFRTGIEYLGISPPPYEYPPSKVPHHFRNHDRTFLSPDVLTAIYTANFRAGYVSAAGAGQPDFWFFLPDPNTTDNPFVEQTYAEPFDFRMPIVDPETGEMTGETYIAIHDLKLQYPSTE